MESETFKTKNKNLLNFNKKILIMKISYEDIDEFTGKRRDYYE